MNWTEEKIKYIKENIHLSNKELGKILGTSYKAVSSKFKVLGIKRTPEQIKQIRMDAQRTWTLEEEQFLRDNYEQFSSREIAEKLGKAKCAVKNRVHTLGLKLSDEIIKERCRFRKGHESWNKGMKGLQIGGKATQFKKGNKPHNTHPVGVIVVRNHRKSGEKYKMISFGGEKRMQLYHRYVWEQHNGPIPKAHIIGFKDGDTLNCDIKNLYCLSKQDNARRNADTEKAVETKNKNIREGKVSDVFVANCLAFTGHSKSGIDKELRDEYLKNPELIQAKKLQLQLKTILKDEHNKNNRAN
jgi:hypothetical protein